MMNLMVQITWEAFFFRGHDEYDGSNNMGNFLECLKLLADHNEAIKRVVLKMPLKI